MSTYKPSDSKREEFRKYLDRTGIMDALTKLLVKLYEEEERPGREDAMAYVIKELGGVKAEDYENAMARLQQLDDKSGSMSKTEALSTAGTQ